MGTRGSNLDQRASGPPRAARVPLRASECDVAPPGPPAAAQPSGAAAQILRRSNDSQRHNQTTHQARTDRARIEHRRDWTRTRRRPGSTSRRPSDHCPLAPSQRQQRGPAFWSQLRFLTHLANPALSGGSLVATTHASFVRFPRTMCAEASSSYSRSSAAAIHHSSSPLRAGMPHREPSKRLSTESTRPDGRLDAHECCRVRSSRKHHGGRLAQALQACAWRTARDLRVSRFLSTSVPPGERFGASRTTVRRRSRSAIAPQSQPSTTIGLATDPRTVRRRVSRDLAFQKGIVVDACGFGSLAHELQHAHPLERPAPPEGKKRTFRPDARALCCGFVRFIPRDSDDGHADHLRDF